MAQHVAVLDVGKTNKKVVVFDEDFNIVELVFADLPVDESGEMHVDPAAETVEWFLGELAKLTGRVDIAAISVTTHGATFACVDAAGGLALPVISYTNDPGEEFTRGFYEKYGDARALHRELATPNLGGLANLAKGIEFARSRFPDAFENTKYILNYPQYFGHMLTGNAGAETTYTGCHTYLWDFETKGWSRVAARMGITDKLPETVGRSGDALGTIRPEIAERTGLSPETIVTLGIHDSNASLLPYLVTSQGRFILNSTGTWCVTMRPSETMELTDSEMDAGVFYNVDASANPVKTAIFMGGEEFRQHTEILKERFGLGAYPDYDERSYQSVVSDANQFLLPGVMPASGPFPNSTSRIVEGDRVYAMDELSRENRPDFYASPERAYAVLVLSLAVQTSVMFENIGLVSGMTVYVEGGFVKNKPYLAILSALCPEADIKLTSLEEATSFGAAILAWAAVAGSPVESIGERFTIECEDVPRRDLNGMAEYRDAFVTLASS